MFVGNRVINKNSMGIVADQSLKAVVRMKWFLNYFPYDGERLQGDCCCIPSDK